MVEAKLISFEGQGLNGKTTQVELAATRLRRHGVEVVTTFHPGGNPTSEKLRQELLERKNNGITPMEEFDLMTRSVRVLHDEVVAPALEKNQWVLTSRWWDSAKYYQGMEVGCGVDLIEPLEADCRYQPDLKLLLEVPAEEIYRRTQSITALQGRELHAFNPNDLEKLKTRERGFRELANKGDNWVFIDGVGTIDEVHQRIWQAIREEFFTE